MDHLSSEISQIQKNDELEHIQIKQRVIAEQRKLKEQKERQKRFVNNEFRRKYAETQDEKHERLAKERAEKPKGQSRPNQSGGAQEGTLDQSQIVQFLEDKKQGLATMVLPADIQLIIKLHPEQAQTGTLIVNKMRMLCNRNLTLIHLATLIAHKNDLKEDEWPNFEFYPCLETTTLGE